MSSTQCAALDLDTPLSHLSDIDTSTSKNGNKIRVLYLATIRSLFMMTDRWIFHTYMALTNTNEYEVILWGIGMPGFHLNETTKQNVQRWFVDPLFDIVITSWPYHTTSKGRVDSDVERDMYGHRGDDFVGLPGSPIISTIVHELSWQGYERLIRPNIVFVVYNQFLGINVTVDSCGRIQSASSADGSNSGMCQLNPYLETLVGACPVGDRCSQNRTRTMLAYMPHGIYHPLYHPYANITNQEKVHNVLLIGAVHRFIYPLRHTAQQAMRQTKSISQLRHPGYAMSWGESLVELCKYYSKVTRVQHRRYMESLAHSRICLIGSGSQLIDSCPSVAWAIRKYYEAMAAGCVVIGDIPSDPSIAQFIPIQLTGLDPAQLAQAVETASERYTRGEFNALKNRARDFVLRKYSYEAVIQRFFTPAVVAYLQANNPYHPFLQRLAGKHKIARAAGAPRATTATGTLLAPKSPAAAVASHQPYALAAPEARMVQAAGAAGAGAAGAVVVEQTAVETPAVTSSYGERDVELPLFWRGTNDGGGVFENTRPQFSVRNDRAQCQDLVAGSSANVTNSTSSANRTHSTSFSSFLMRHFCRESGTCD